MSVFLNTQSKHYQTKLLEEQNIPGNPLTLFEQWFEEALSKEFIEPSAMNLSTVSPDGVVSSRMVLLKAFNNKGFVFFTNYKSQKAKDLSINKNVALTIWWDKLYRQVRITGAAEKVLREESVEYFRSRPIGSQLGALASQQSTVIENYSVLEKEYERLEAMYKNQEVPCPEHWGGYLVVPLKIEFWQGRPNRLHDRLCYEKNSSDNWKVERLSP